MLRASNSTTSPGSRGPGPRRGALLAAVLTVLLALPAGAQEAPQPTPSPSPSPSPTPSPTPSLASGEAVRTTATPRTDTRRRRKLRRQRKLSRRARWTAESLRGRQRCGPFGHTQTYSTWGPALAYDESVTVVYEASHCTKPSGTAVELTIQGTAKVYRGALAQGTPIDTRPFTAAGLWDRPENPSGWPPPWWSCKVKLARYTWVIADVYTFAVSARWGVWSLEVTSRGVTDDTFRWTHNACN